MLQNMLPLDQYQWFKRLSPDQQALLHPVIQFQYEAYYAVVELINELCLFEQRGLEDRLRYSLNNALYNGEKDTVIEKDVFVSEFTVEQHQELEHLIDARLREFEDRMTKNIVESMRGMERTNKVGSDNVRHRQPRISVNYGNDGRNSNR